MTMRYDAQICLPEIGILGQEKLSSAQVLVVGAGGLGAVLLPTLVGAGVGHIHIMDDDVVEEGNLHRQTLYRMADIGEKKAIAAVRHLRALNPSVTLTPHVTGAQADNTKALLQNLQANAEKHSRLVVFDAADNFATTYMLSDLCRELGIALISASAIRWGGYVGIFCKNAPSYRALFPVLEQKAQDCRTAGVMGSVVGMISMLQAQLYFSLLLDIKPSPTGILYRWDALSLRMSSFSFLTAQEPDKVWPFLSYKQLEQTDLVIDVRIPGEKPSCPHENLRHIPLDQFSRVKEFDLPFTDSRIVLVCQSGARAARAAALLWEQGYRNLALLAAKHQEL